MKNRRVIPPTPAAKSDIFFEKSAGGKETTRREIIEKKINVPTLKNFYILLTHSVYTLLVRCY